MASTSKTVSKVEVEPTMIKAVPDADLGLKTYDPELLFHLAGEQERQKKKSSAEKLYLKLLKEFPTSRFVEAARYNLGLLLEDKKLFRRASEEYEEILQGYKGLGSDELPQIWVDTRLRLGVCYYKLGAFGASATSFSILAEQTWVDLEERVEAYMGLGIALQKTDREEETEAALTRALSLARRLMRRGQRDERRFGAEAAFRLGLISAKRFRDTSLEFPMALLRKRLEEKCRFLLEAQSRYLRAVRMGDVQTISAAGLNIGKLYEGLYREIIQLQPPQNLTEFEVEVYNEEVKRKVLVLLRKAIKVYEKAARVSRRLARKNPWLKKLEQSLTTIRKLYLKAEDELAAADAMMDG